MTMTDRRLYLPGHISVGQAVEQVGGEAALRQLLLPNALTPDQMKEWKRLRDSHYFLVRNRDGGTGERYRCTRHSFTAGVTEPVYHEYFTTMCVDRPWRGLEDALWAYTTITKDERMAIKMSSYGPDALASHPRSFGGLTTSGPVAELVAFALGTLEPISESRAQLLAKEINSKRPPKPFVL